MKKWPTYFIEELKLKWTFYSIIRGKNWAIGLIKLEDAKLKAMSEEGE